MSAQLDMGFDSMVGNDPLAWAMPWEMPNLETSFKPDWETDWMTNWKSKMGGLMDSYYGPNATY